MESDDAKLWERAEGFDATGRERRVACRAVAECPTCGADVELIADTESWVEAAGGKWVHDSYGPAQGVCCGNLIVDSWDNMRVYDLGGEGGEGGGA